MRIGFVIEQLGRGGSEIQMMRLASSLAARSHDVEVFAYDGASPFDHELEAAGVAVRTASSTSRLSKIRRTREWVSQFRPHVVHGVMMRGSSVAILALLGRKGTRMVATEMSAATFGTRKPELWASLVLFGFADRVVTQTQVNRMNLDRLAPWLRGKTAVIRNGVDTRLFAPLTGPRKRDAVFRFAVIGTVYPVKNPKRVVEAVNILLGRGVRDFRVDWFGRLGLAALPHERPEDHPVVQYAASTQVDTHICFHGDSPNIERLLQGSDAVLLASVREGFPNAVVEGMACGLPIVVSRVSDLPLVVAEAQNGFVFDETDPAAIATAMERMMTITDDERRCMGRRSRELAVRWFALERFVDDFEHLYTQLVAEGR